MPSLGQFIAARRPTWLRLETALARAEGNGLRRFGAKDLDQLGRDYRQVIGDLAAARRDFPDDEVTGALNALAARAHLRLYRAPTGSWARIVSFFLVGYPRRVRAAWPYLLAATALLVVPAIWAYLAALLDPTLRAALVPAEMRSLMERGRTWTDIEAGLRPMMAAFIFTHNLQVSFLAFAGGVLFGLGTVYTLVANGLQLGAVFGAAQAYGVSGLLGAFVSAHGYLEIASILIAAAAGLMLGDAMVRPGLLRRRDALTRAGRRALELVVGAAPVFVVAGLVEGFVSPSDLPVAFKAALGPLLGLALVAFLLFAGRERSATSP